MWTVCQQNILRSIINFVVSFPCFHLHMQFHHCKFSTCSIVDEPIFVNLLQHLHLSSMPHRFVTWTGLLFSCTVTPWGDRMGTTYYSLWLELLVEI